MGSAKHFTADKDVKRSRLSHIMKTHIENGPGPDDEWTGLRDAIPASPSFITTFYRQVLKAQELFDTLDDFFISDDKDLPFIPEYDTSPTPESF